MLWQELVRAWSHPRIVLDRKMHDPDVGVVGRTRCANCVADRDAGAPFPHTSYGRKDSVGLLMNGEGVRGLVQEIGALRAEDCGLFVAETGEGGWVL